MTNDIFLELENSEWKEFVLENIFDISSTSSGIDRNKLVNKAGLFPYLTRSESNNGYSTFVCKQPSYTADNSNVITIGLDTQTVFYQPHMFYTGQNIQVLRCDKLNENVSQFLIPLIKRQMVKFNWGGNGATLTRLKRSKLLLPINAKGEPNFEFMETYIKQMEQEKFKQYKNRINRRLNLLRSFKTVERLQEKEWSGFFIEDVVKILAGRDIYGSERIAGHTPYISSTAKNNGISHFVGNNNLTKEEGCLSVNRNGSVGYSFFHPYDALFSNDCRKLRLKQPSKYIGLFISQQITKQRTKYGYGYKMGTARLKKQKIMLPVNKKNEPDYTYMESYMKQLEYKKLSEYLSYKQE